ncbi:MAG TPA: galactokinase family protein, partial [Limnochordia bacterium]|nr:galactokinase family protein [Limnochordia bacterium]
MAIDIRRTFRTLYGAAPEAVVRSPYRVCPLGAHVDHQYGQVSAFALENALKLALRPRTDGRVQLRSSDFAGLVTFDLANPGAAPKGWGAYVYGAAYVLGEKLRVGLDGLVQGELPVGGLSSSAALSTAALSALAHVNGIELEPQALIQAAHRIEREVIGLKSGLLDQSANVLSRRGYLLWLDCLTRAHRL